jgi:hypothetical protein
MAFPIRKRRKLTHRLLLEVLEDRTVPSVNWINPVSGDWNTASNWFDTATGTNHVPGATDDVVINTSGIAVTDSLDSTANSLTLSGATLSASGNMLLNQMLTLSGGTLTGGGSLTANGIVVNSGTLDAYTLVNPVAQNTTLTGKLDLRNGAEFENDGSLVVGNAGIMERGSGDTSAVLLLNGNTGNITKPLGSGEALLLLPINSAGPITLDEGSIDLGDFFFGAASSYSGQVTGEPGTTLFLYGGGTFTSDFSAGKVHFSTGIGTGPFDAYTLQADYSSSDLEVDSGLVDLSQATVSSSLATVDIGGTLIAPPTLVVQNLTLGGGPAVLNADDLTITQHFAWESGTLASIKTTIASAATMTVTSGTLQGGDLVNDGTTVLSGANETLVVSGGATIDNNGSVLGEVVNSVFEIAQAGAGGVFENNATGTLTQALDGALRFRVPFDNDSAISQGVVVQAGALELIGGGTSSGNFHVDSNAELDCIGTFGGAITGDLNSILDFNAGLESAVSALLPSSQIVSDGEVFFFGGFDTVAGTYAVSDSGSTMMQLGPDVDFTGSVNGVGSALTVAGVADFNDSIVNVATLNLDGLFVSEADLNVSTTWNWGGGAGIDGPGTATAGLAATLTAVVTNDYLLGGRQLVNEGTASFQSTAGGSGTFFMNGGASIINDGTCNLAVVDFQYSDSPSFLNQEFGPLPLFPTAGPASFVNNGTVIRTSDVGNPNSLPGGAAIFGTNNPAGAVAFDNDGTVIVQQGTVADDYLYIMAQGTFAAFGALNPIGGGNSSGNFQVDAGADMGFTGTLTGLISADVGSFLDFNDYETFGSVFEPSARVFSLGAIDVGGDGNALTLPFTNGPSGVEFASISANQLFLSGPLDITETSPLDLHLGEQLTIVNNTGSDPINGTFGNLAQGAFINLPDGTQMQISYDGGPNGNDVVLTVTAASTTTPTFTNLTASPTITYGTASVTLSGHLDSNAASAPVPAGETVDVTLDGITQAATLDSNDDFTTTFATGALPVSGSPYPISYSYGGDSQFNSTADNSTVLTVAKATPTFTDLTGPGASVLAAFAGDYSGSFVGTIMSPGGQSGPAGALNSFTINSAGVMTITSPGSGTATLVPATDGSLTAAVSGIGMIDASLTGGPGHSEYSFTGTFSIVDGLAVVSGEYTATDGVSTEEGTWSDTSADQSGSTNPTPLQITYGTASVTLAGHLAANAGQELVPAGEIVTVTLNGVSRPALLDGGDNFSATFDTHALSVSGSPYVISYGYAGDADFNAASDSSTTLIVVPATPVVSVTDAGGVYTGNPFPATVLITGVVGAAGGSLEGVAPTLTYYAGSSATGTPLPGAPTIAGAYTVVASFAGSADYAAASAQVAFTISQATPTVNVSDAGGAYNGSGFAATATVAGINDTAGSSLEGTGLTLTYYAGTFTDVSQLTGLIGSSIAPNMPGTYTVLASFAGSSDYASATALTSFTVTAAAASVAGDVYVLNQTATGALTMSGNALLQVGGVLQVDSSSASAVNLSGNAKVVDAKALIVGGDQISGNASFSNAPVTHAADVVNPLAGLVAPTGGANLGAINLSSGTLVINPGLYSSINVSGNAHLILTPGIYSIGAGGINISGGATVTDTTVAGGPGVLIYNTGAFTVSGNAMVNLTASSTGIYAGLAIFQAQSNSAAVSFSGNASVNLNGGILYAANVHSVVAISGSATVEASLVVNELNLSGSSDDSAE